MAKELSAVDGEPAVHSLSGVLVSQIRMTSQARQEAAIWKELLIDALEVIGELQTLAKRIGATNHDLRKELRSLRNTISRERAA
jgi:hypothetical protein